MAETSALYNLVYSNVIDTSKWTGPDPSWNDIYWTRIIGLSILGTVWGVLFKLLYVVVDFLSLQFFPAYKGLNKIQRVDWSSRVVAMVFIIINTYQAFLLYGQGGHYLVAEGEGTTFETGRWKLDTTIDPRLLYLLFLYFSTEFGYELYDLKNCWDIKMYSGVLHHLVLLVIFPLNWSITTISVPAVWMTASTYLTNVPAHIRSFMVHTGYRDVPFYHWNKWAWWYSYVLFRLFGIPWFSAIMWYTIPAMKTQSPLGNIVWYFSAMVIHYGLSLYWFVEMSKTMFPVSAQMKREGSYALIPKTDAKKPVHRGKEKRSKAGNKSESESSEDEGGQKFD